ncbi:MAG: hypothetical protein ACREMX_04680, partial [Gemmatimonadales bacterium]
MTGRLRILAGATLLLGLPGPEPVADGKESGPSLPFAVAGVRFEQNVTDGDVEVVFEIKGGKEGLAELAVVSPDGRTVINFMAPDTSTLGIRQFQFESPEPGDVEGLKAAYPEGLYTFAGATAAGAKLNSKARLSHRLPPMASLVRPRPGSRSVSARDLEITWTPVRNLAAHLVKIEQPDLDVEITARLPGSVASFA